jgi:hypothetical protein
VYILGCYLIKIEKSDILYTIIGQTLTRFCLFFLAPTKMYKNSQLYLLNPLIQQPGQTTSPNLIIFRLTAPMYLFFIINPDINNDAISLSNRLIFYLFSLLQLLINS